MELPNTNEDQKDTNNQDIELCSSKHVCNVLTHILSNRVRQYSTYKTAPRSGALAR